MPGLVWPRGEVGQKYAGHAAAAASLLHLRSFERMFPRVIYGLSLDGRSN